MQPIEVVWWGGQRGSWCQCIVEFLTEGMTHRMDISELQGDGAIVVVKADQIKSAEELNEILLLKWCLVIITANEDGGIICGASSKNMRFISTGAHVLASGNLRLWLQTPHKHQTADRYIPWGWTPGCADKPILWVGDKETGYWAAPPESPKLYDWSFAGQITHSRREEFLKVARTLPAENRMLVTSEGFSQGIAQDAYYKTLAATKVAPCPSGPITVDSMRVCEALQLGAVPVIDSISPIGPYPEYWKRVFGHDHPLIVVHSWEQFPVNVSDITKRWDAYAPLVFSWWQRYKANLRGQLRRDLIDLGAL